MTSNLKKKKSTSLPKVKSLLDKEKKNKKATAHFSTVHNFAHKAATNAEVTFPQELLETFEVRRDYG